MSARPKLNIVDDPVARRTTPPDESPTPAPEPQEPVGRPPVPATTAAGLSAANGDKNPQTPADAAQPVAPAKPEGYAQESKKAVFGRVPRSLSRRLERAVLELREDTDDLTQEQVLAALLDKYVNPADAGNLTTLSTTVNEYRARL